MQIFVTVRIDLTQELETFKFSLGYILHYPQEKYLSHIAPQFKHTKYYEARAYWTALVHTTCRITVYLFVTEEVEVEVEFCPDFSLCCWLWLHFSLLTFIFNLPFSSLNIPRTRDCISHILIHHILGICDFSSLIVISFTWENLKWSFVSSIICSHRHQMQF
jgi:hypothetical protein